MEVEARERKRRTFVETRQVSILARWWNGIQRTFLFNFHCADTAYCSTFVIALHSIRFVDLPLVIIPASVRHSAESEFCLRRRSRLAKLIKQTFDRKTNKKISRFDFSPSVCLFQINRKSKCRSSKAADQWVRFHSVILLFLFLLSLLSHLSILWVVLASNQLQKWSKIYNLLLYVQILYVQDNACWEI